MDTITIAELKKEIGEWWNRKYYLSFEVIENKNVALT